MVHSDSIWNDVKCGADLSLSNVRGPEVIFKRLFSVVNYIIHWTWYTINNGTRESLNFKLLQNNLFVQLNLVKMCPKKPYLPVSCGGGGGHAPSGTPGRFAIL